MLRPLLFAISIFLTFQVQAIVNGHEYPFNDGTDAENYTRAQLFRELAEELRCPKCQNQNLSDSNAMIASDLRRELYKQVKAGKEGQDIIDFMVNRYGEFVLYNPKIKGITLVLWFGPVALFLLALLVFVFVVRSRRKQSKQNIKNDELDEQELQRVQQLLHKTEQEGK
ncbi:MAG: cytochrome c-type biogenesis protein [Bermanella sp.]